MRRFFLLGAVGLAVSTTVLGDYTNLLENTTSQTITNGWDAVGDMTVGRTTSNNTLRVIFDGSLTNDNAFVGEQAGASNNTATVSGSGATWINTGTLNVGAVSNAGNSVSVSSGGTIFANDLAMASNNTFNLSRDGTLALSEGLEVSQAGFNWTAGGTLSVGGALTGLATTNAGTILSGEKNLVLNGGSLSTSTNLVVGYESSNNSLGITDGGTVANENGYIGWGPDASDNTVLVSGLGSAWTNNGNLYVGVYETNLLTAGTGNSLTVSNQAWVFVGGEDTNLTAMGSGGITVADGAEMGVGETAAVLADGVYLGSNGNFNLDGALTVNHAFDADQAGFNWNEGGSLTVHGALTLDTVEGTNQTLNVDGGSWSRAGDLQIAGSGNTVSIRNGGGVTNAAGEVGGSNTTVLVSDAGSHWLNQGTLSIVDSSNSVVVGSGGKITADALNIEAGNDLDLNQGGTLAMTGGFDLSVQTNLNWNTDGNLSVGGLLEGMAVVTNLPTADASYLGGRKTLTLDGGRWLADDNNLIVGLNDDLNHLVLTNGGSVDNADGYIGWGNSGDFNTVVVGAGSAWTNSGNLYVGTWLDANTNLVDAGKENSLTVQDDGWVFVGEGRVGGASGGLVVASTNGAELVVGGDESLVEVGQTLYVGTDVSSTGSVVVSSGGSVVAGDLLLSANSTFDLYGSLALATNFNAGQDGFEWYDGSTLSVGGELTGLDTQGLTNRSVVIDGGTWDTTGSDLLITGATNTYSIMNGGVAESDSAFIGVSSNDVGNTVLVDGAESEWRIATNLFVNTGNTLALASTGVVTVGGSMFVSNATVSGSGTVELGGATSLLSVYGTNSVLSPDVKFDGKGGAVAFTDSKFMVDGSLTNRFVNFDRLSLTHSILAGTGTVGVFTNINMMGGWIAPDGELTIDGIFATTNTTLQVTAGADRLHVTGALNLSGLLAEVSITNNTVTSAFSEDILVADSGLTGDFAETNFNEHFLLYDFTLGDDGTTVSVVSEAAADGEISASPTYAAIQGVRAGFNGMQNAAFVRTKQLRRNSVGTDQAISQETYLMQKNIVPDGAQGPGDQNTIFGMHFWIDQFSGQGDYDAVGNSDGFSLNNNGTSFGFDKLIGDSLVLGGNYTYARSRASLAGGDHSETETYWLGLYADWFAPNDYYLEGLLALGWSDYETVRVEGGYQGEGTFEGNDFGAHLEGGKYFHHKNWAFAPYVGMQYLGIKSETYTEADLAGGPSVSVDAQSVASLESALGVKLRHRFDTTAGRFQTVGYTEWTYDFINDDIGSSLSDGTITVGTARIAPGAGVLNAGLGFSWICTEYLEVGVGYDGRFNENYEEHTGSIMLDVRF